MLMISGLPPLQDTRHSRELCRRVEQAIRDYQRDHPDATETDVRTALLRSAPTDTQVERRRRAIGIAASLLLAAGFAVMASTGGGDFSRLDGNPLVWRVLGATAALAAVAIALIRLARRS